MKKKEIAKYDYFDIVLGRKILGIVKMADKKQKSDTIRETKYVYDTKNRLVSYTDPEGRTETYTYDCNSNLTKTVDKNGNTLKNTYDNQNRLTERTAKEKKTGKETVHTYRYNAYGDVAVQDDTQFVYGDVSGQVTKETTKLTKNKDVVKNYTYDSKGNKSTFSVKAGEDTKLSLSYEYDGSSRLISVKDSEGNRAVSYAYDTEGSLSERQAANGLKTTYGYDYQNRLTSMTNETGKGVVSKYSSTYLKNGQKAEEVSTVMDKKGKSTKKTAAYTYDMLGRITRETKTGREDISYTYDANNNRKQMTIGNKTTAYQYNKNDELLRTDTLHTDTEKNDVVIYKNDKNGNRLATVNRSEIPAEAKDTSYIDVDVTLGDNQLNDNVVNHYNALNQLTETLTKNYKVSFTYDAEGLRTGKTVNGEKTIYVWDGDQVVMELSKGGAVQKRYIRGNDLVYADKGENTEKTYYVTDMHGNVVQLLDESGNVTKTYEYDSFGNEVKPEKKDENPYRYCGEYYDKETEEVYLRARYYEPSVGRFITRDTYTGESDEPLSLHLYTYCENDGVNMVDPSGHMYGYSYKDSNGQIHTEGFEWISRRKGKVFKTEVKELRICTDGKVTNQMKKNKYYGDSTHGKRNTTSCFGKYVSADEIPYIVVPPSESRYKYSLGVIIDTNNGNYLYCVVAEIGPEANGMGEVSIYVGWKMKGLKIPKDISKVKKECMIGDKSQEATKKWKIILFEKSSPKPMKNKKKYGWKYKGKASKFRKQIKKIGSKCYKGTGKCLN